MTYICVLNDGETYTDLRGCAIVAVPDGADAELIEELLDAERSSGGATSVAYFDIINGQPTVQGPDGDVLLVIPT